MPEIPQATADKAAAIQARLNAEVSAARNNSDLTADGKRKLIARAYLTADADMTKLKDSWQGNAATDSVVLAKDIFGAATTSGVDAISARDADDRASRLENPAEAADLLQRAEENGDSVLARAIAQRAYRERGAIFGGQWEAILDAYTEKRPQVAEKLLQLEGARRDTVQTGFMAAMIFSVPKPPELGYASGSSLEAIAGIG